MDGKPQLQRTANETEKQAQGMGGSRNGRLAKLARLPIQGQLIRAGDHGYDEQRKVWNGSIDRHPGAIIRCRGIADVSASVRFARENDVLLAVRGGGHSFPGLSVCDGGIVIDLRQMNDVEVDLTSSSVRVGAGTLIGELDRATQIHGLAVPTGAVTHTGVAGLTLGGGVGWLMRKHGLTIDQLLSVELVTAEGRHVRASREENPDLFWGVRGGGGNFGIVTEFEFRLRKVGPMVLSGLMLWPLEQGRTVIRRYRDWIEDSPDELTTALALRRAPAADFVPTGMHGRPVVAVVFCWCGRQEPGERLLQPMRSPFPPILDTAASRPFVEHQAMLDASYPHGVWAYLRACDVKELSDEIIDISLDQAAQMESPRSTVTIWQLGGAVARVSADATAFGSRDSGHIFNITGATDSAEGFGQERAWARKYFEALSPHQSSVYVNFMMEEGEERVRQAYGARRYQRLKELKRKYDPDNIFRLNQNIRPD